MGKLKNSDIINHFDDDKDDGLKISIQIVPEVEHCIILTLKGYIDTYNNLFLSKQIAKIRGSHFNKLIFDCTSLSYMSSTGIGAFISIWSDLKKTGGNLVTFGMSDKVIEPIRLLGFIEYFNVKNNVKEAIEFFS